MKNNIFLFFVIIFTVYFTGCFNRIKNPVISNLNIKDTGIKLGKGQLSIKYFENNLKLLSAYTKKDFSNYKLTFIPYREENFDKAFSIFIHRQDENNYYRLNIFLKNGSAHFYRNKDKKIESIHFSKVKSFNKDFFKNVYMIEVNEDKIKLSLNGEEYYSGKLEYNRGKIGIGAYGTKGNNARFIFKNPK